MYPVKLDFVRICYNLPLLFQIHKAENIYLELKKKKHDLNLPANVPVEVLIITITPGWDNGANHLINKNFAFKLLIICL